MIETRHAFTDHTALRDFMFGGRAVFTVKSHRSGKHITYRVSKAHSHENVWFVHYLQPNTRTRGMYLGSILGDAQEFKATRSTSAVVQEGDAFKGFAFLFSRMARGIPSQVTVYHEGKCGMCGRKLTDPASIVNGIGPECAKKELRHGFMYVKDDT